MPTASFCHRVHVIVLGKPPAADPEAFFIALSAAATAGPSDASRPDKLLELAHVLNDGVPCGALSSQIHERGTILNRYRYEREPGWRFGTHHDRRGVVEAMWKDGTTTGGANGRVLARGAVLLAAEEGFPYGAATVRWLVRDPAFASLTGLAPADMAPLISLLDEEDGRTRAFVALLGRAKLALDALLTQTTIDGALLQGLIVELERIATLAAQRPDVQWRLANLTWRLAVTARRRGRPDVEGLLNAAVSRWKVGLNEATAARWLDEAMSADAPELRTSGFRTVPDSEAFRPIPRGA
jgi:hypothetical protein